MGGRRVGWEVGESDRGRRVGLEDGESDRRSGWRGVRCRGVEQSTGQTEGGRSAGQSRSVPEYFESRGIGDQDDTRGIKTIRHRGVGPGSNGTVGQPDTDSNRGEWTCRTCRLHTKQRGAETVPVETKGCRYFRLRGEFVRLEPIGWVLVEGVPDDTPVSPGFRFEWKPRSCRHSLRFSGDSRREWPETDGCPPPLRFGWNGEKRGVGEGPISNDVVLLSLSSNRTRTAVTTLFERV
jgi:hypothetical protein